MCWSIAAGTPPAGHSGRRSEQRVEPVPGLSSAQQPQQCRHHVIAVTPVVEHEHLGVSPHTPLLPAAPPDTRPGSFPATVAHSLTRPEIDTKP